MECKYAIILKDDEVIAVLQPRDYDVLYEYCTESQLKDKLAYWQYIVNYDPVKVKQEEQKFLERNELKRRGTKKRH